MTAGPLAVASPWFAVERLDEGIARLWEPHVDEFFQSNVWHVEGRDRDLVIDTANGIGDLRAELRPLAGDRPLCAVVTHAHFDHVGGLHGFEDRMCHPADAPEVERPLPLRLLREDFPAWLVEDIRAYGYEPPACVLTALPVPGFDLAAFRTPPATPTRRLDDGDTVDLGDRVLEVIHVPGHTPGSIALWDAERRMLFTGDTAYVGDELIASDGSSFRRSLERLGTLPALVVHPGHGESFDGAELRRLVARELG